jgi:hypothetical protein
VWIVIRAFRSDADVCEQVYGTLMGFVLGGTEVFVNDLRYVV